jgi:hypothetical protein
MSASGSVSKNNVTPSITSSVWQVEGHPTEVLELPAARSTPEVQLLIIAGNPGAAPFYRPFMRHLSETLGGRAAVTAISNLGMVGGCWQWRQDSNV